MLFNSYTFIFGFMPVVAVVFFVLGRHNHRWASAWLTAASVFFYGWWNPAYVGLLLGSVLFNYSVGYSLARAKAEVRLGQAGNWCSSSESPVTLHCLVTTNTPIFLYQT